LSSSTILFFILNPLSIGLLRPSHRLPADEKADDQHPNEQGGEHDRALRGEVQVIQIRFIYHNGLAGNGSLTSAYLPTFLAADW
jgi:hypothetical protein